MEFGKAQTRKAAEGAVTVNKDSADGKQAAKIKVDNSLMMSSLT